MIGSPKVGWSLETTDPVLWHGIHMVGTNKTGAPVSRASQYFLAWLNLGALYKLID